jgi:hypothetical protein
MAHPINLNCYISFAVVIFGLFFFFAQLGPGKAFQPRFMRWAFGLWISNYLILALLYLDLAFSHRIPLAGRLVMSDLGSLSWIAFFFVYVLGDDLAPPLPKPDPNDVSPAKRDRSNIRRLIVVLGVVLGLAATFAIVGDLLDFEKGRLRSLSLIAMPQLLANISALLLGWAFLVRYGPSVTAMMLFVATCLYALAQSPAYLAVFVIRGTENNTQDFAGLFYFLAMMKVILALLCYALFASPFWRSLEPVASEIYIFRARMLPSVDTKPLDTRISRIFLYLAQTVAGAFLVYLVGRLLGLLSF